MVTHHFNEDHESGYFADDYGRRICHWSWVASSKILRVRVGHTGNPVDLSSFGIDRLSEKELPARLIEIAQSAGEKLGANFRA